MMLTLEKWQKCISKFKMADSFTSAMQGIKGASLSEKGLIRSITGGSGIGCMVQESIIQLYHQQAYIEVV